jgi:hypothetical protein
MLVLCGGIFVVMRWANDWLIMNHMVLERIDLALQEGDVARVRHAISEYRKTYESTGQLQAAVLNAHSELSR